jgi:VWFA-related protein
VLTCLKALSRLPFALALVGMLVYIASAQAPGPPPQGPPAAQPPGSGQAGIPTAAAPPQSPVAPIKRDLRISQFDLSAFPLVRLFASVTDTRGLPIKNLDITNFALTENGSEVPELRFANPEVFDLPLAICFVIDVSGSMQGDIPPQALRSIPLHGVQQDEPTPLELEIEAVKGFIHQLESDDQVALIKFADAVVTVQDFTADKELVTDALDHLRAFGQTRLYDAVRQGMNLTRFTQGYRRAVIVLSDGMDNASTETPDTLVEYFRLEILAQNESFSVFTLGLGDQIDVNGLSYIADSTGGRFFLSPTAYDLKEIYQTILEQILNEYVIEYDSAEKRQGAIVDGTLMVNWESRTATTDFTFRSPGLGSALARMLWPGVILMVIAFITLVVLTLVKLLRAAWVTVMVAPLEGKDFALRDENLIGRGEECNIQIRHDPDVLAQHALVQLGSDGFVLAALDEDNPPLHRGMPVRTARLQDGDEFIIGSTRVVFRERRVRKEQGEIDIDYLMEQVDMDERQRRAELGLPEPSAEVRKPATSAMVVTGPHSGMSFELKAELVVGRKEGIILLPEDRQVSRQHLVIRRVGDSVEVEDLGSTNGTELNGRKLTPHQPEAAGAGDIIALGDTKIKLL